MKHIKEGDVYFAIEIESIPVLKGEDFDSALISMSVWDENSTKSGYNFRHLEDAIEFCFKDKWFNVVAYSDYRMDGIINLTNNKS